MLTYHNLFNKWIFVQKNIRENRKLNLRFSRIK
jgi:hypothetical protein